MLRRKVRHTSSDEKSPPPMKESATPERQKKSVGSGRCARRHRRRPQAYSYVTYVRKAEQEAMVDPGSARLLLVFRRRFPRLWPGRLLCVIRSCGGSVVAPRTCEGSTPPRPIPPRFLLLLAVLLLCGFLPESNTVASFPSCLLGSLPPYLPASSCLPAPPYLRRLLFLPQVLKGKTLPNGKSCFEGRPGAEMPDYNFGKEV